MGTFYSKLVGSFLFAVGFTRRRTPWVHYEGRRRYDHLFSFCRIYDRDERLYMWRLAIGPVQFCVTRIPKEWPA